MLNFDPAWLAPYFILRPGNLTVTVTQKIIAPNASRVGVIFAAAITSPQIWFDQSVETFGGFTVNAGGPPTVLKYADIGPLVGGEIWVAGGVTATLNWYEIIFTPPPPGA